MNRLYQEIFVQILLPLLVMEGLQENMLDILNLVLDILNFVLDMLNLALDILNLVLDIQKLDRFSFV